LCNSAVRRSFRCHKLDSPLGIDLIFAGISGVCSTP
jgi:hypothetical protein